MVECSLVAYFTTSNHVVTDELEKIRKDAVVA
jgi:hypothetical protein